MRTDAYAHEDRCSFAWGHMHYCILPMHIDIRTHVKKHEESVILAWGACHVCMRRLSGQSMREMYLSPTVYIGGVLTLSSCIPICDYPHAFSLIGGFVHEDRRLKCMRTAQLRCDGTINGSVARSVGQTWWLQRTHIRGLYITTELRRPHAL